MAFYLNWSYLPGKVNMETFGQKPNLFIFFLIFVFPFLSFSVFFVLNSLTIEHARVIYYKFNNSFPVEVSRYQWAINRNLPMENALLCALSSGIVSSLLAFFLLYFLAKSSSMNSKKLGDRAVLKGFACFGAYLIGYLFCCFVLNNSFFNYADFFINFIVAVIYYFSVFYYFFLNERAQMRRKDCADKLAWLKHLEIEHSYLKEHLHFSIYVLVIMPISALTVLYNYYFGLPAEISNHPAQLNLLLLFIFGVIVYPVVAFFIGVVAQLLGGIEDIFTVIMEKID